MSSQTNTQESTSALLLTYQFKVVFDDSRVIVVEKSRRIGLSWAIACKAVLVAMASKGQDVWYVGYNREMAQEFIRDCAFWAKTFGEVTDLFGEATLDNTDKDVLNYGIKFASGFRITALSSKPSNLRGKQGLVIIDEAAFHDQLGELLKAAMALLIWGGQVIIISTHNGVDNPFNQLCEEIRAGKKSYKLFKIVFDEAVKQGLYQRICQMRGIKWTAEKEREWVAGIYQEYGDDADEELRVIPSNSGGAVLSRALLNLRADDVPVLTLEKSTSFGEMPKYQRREMIADWCDSELAPLLDDLDATREHVFGQDFARSGDLSVLAPLEISLTTQKRVPFMVELRNIPYDQQEQIVLYILQRLPRFSNACFDATGNGEWLAEAIKDVYGNRIDAVKLNNAWYENNMPAFVAAFEDDDIRIPKNSNVIDDLRSLQRIDGIIKLPKGKTGNSKDRHGDAAIALALAYTASRQEIDYVPKATAGKRRVTEQLTEGY
ncbi:MAG: hypothetical protein KGV56_00150 [Gammaproteobacteria bacterium]|nr:hypothetical protein [Gammaproteobacteria bacterium]